MRAMKLLAGVVVAAILMAAKRPEGPWVTPALPDGKSVLSTESTALLRQPSNAVVAMKVGVVIARTPPRVDLVIFPGQTYRGNPWSNWSDGCVLNGKYYTALSDHLSPQGSGYVYEYDPRTKAVRLLVGVKEFLQTQKLLASDERYTPGKIHSRVMAGRDGWLYFATHRGNPREATAAIGYKGDWILRTWPDPDPARVKTEVVMAYPVARHSMPAGLLDADRMVFYVGTANGADAEEKRIMFLAVDCTNRQVIATAPDGFDRYAILAKSTGRVYWRTLGKGDEARGFRYDPATRAVTACPAVPHVRACTAETAGGKVYGVSGTACEIWEFDTRTETLTTVGDGAVGSLTYVTSMEIDPSGRYLYYVPGAHGGGPKDGTPVVQYDLKTKTRKVLCFMNSLEKEAGATFQGTFSTALSESGDVLFVTWNMGHPVWDSCGMTAISIPASER
jgi:hypothetical protein